MKSPDRLELFKEWLNGEIKKDGPMAFHYRNCLRTIEHYEKRAEPVEIDVWNRRQERQERRNKLAQFNQRKEGEK